VLSFISVVPLLVVPDIRLAVVACVVLTVALLFVAGYVRAYMLRAGRFRDGVETAVETAVLGGGIILVGLVSGLIVNSL